MESERRTPQPLSLDVGVGLDLDAAAGGDIGATVDYEALMREVRFLAETGGWGLIESLASLVVRHILHSGSRGDGAVVKRAWVAVEKPLALGGSAVPRIEIERSVEWFSGEPRTVAPGVDLTLLLEAAEARAYAVDFEPNATWSPQEPVACLVTRGALESGDRRIGVGQRHRATTGLTAGGESARALLVARNADPHLGR